MNRIILASGSPRRKELLGNMGLTFDILVSDVEEIVTESEPALIVKELSNQKAEGVIKMLEEKAQGEDQEKAGGLTETKKAGNALSPVLIAADTLVFHKDKRLGKPKDEEDAKRMLADLSGDSHSVITGVTIKHFNGKSWESVSFAEETKVYFTDLSSEEIEEYVKTGEPMDKAGAYAIQGLAAKFVSRIEGDYSNVVGLPVSRLYQELKVRNWI